MSDQVAADILGLTAQIVSAHVSKNQVGMDALPSLIQSVYRSLSTAGEVEPAAAPCRGITRWSRPPMPPPVRDWPSGSAWDASRLRPRHPSPRCRGYRRGVRA